jgi:hypothetical protein
MNTSAISVLIAATLFHTQPAFAATCDLPMFGGGRMFPAAYGSQFVLTADFNNDGVADLLVLNQGTSQGSISILLGNGDGTFQPPINISMARNQSPRWAGVADFNGDGNPDLVVDVGLSTSLVMLGKGDGTFRAPATIAVQVMAVSDFNGDGRPDLVVAATPIGIMLSKGDGTFQAAIKSPGTSLNLPFSGAVAADFNGDGKPDVVTGNVSGGVFVLLGDGKGNLSAPVAFGYNNWAGFPNQIAVADLNGDRKPDIVTLDALVGKTISVLLGNGNGTFQSGANYPLGSIIGASSLLIADLNGDGNPDVAATIATDSNTPGTIAVFAGKGDGTFQAAVQYNPNGQVNQSLAVGDFNGDGLPDLVFVNGGVSVPPMQVGIVFGKADGTLAAPLAYDPGAPVSGPPVLADLNGDGVPDMAVAINPVGANPLASGANLLVSLGNGDGSFQPPTSYPTANGGAYVAVGDFNNDGKPDLLVSNGNGANVLVFAGNGDGMFQAPRATPVGIPAYAPVVGDFNKDGKLDVIIPGAMLLGNGDGTFRASFTNVAASATVDLNGDGNLDLVVSDNTTDRVTKQPAGVISIQLGKGDGTFQTAVNYPAGSDAESLAIGDLNADGIPDVVVSNLRAGTVAVLLGNGDGTFQAAVHYAAAVGKRSNIVALGDFNGDGFMDLAVASGGTGVSNTADNQTGAVEVLLGSGDGTFRNMLIYGAGQGPTFMTVADVNGDRQPDLLIATGKIWTLLNTYVPGGNSACTPFLPTGN